MKNIEHSYHRHGEQIGVYRSDEHVGMIKTPRAKERLSELLVTLGNTLVPKRDS